MVDTSGGTLRIKDKGQWLNFPYQTFKLTSNLTPDRVDAVRFYGGKLEPIECSAHGSIHCRKASRLPVSSA